MKKRNYKWLLSLCLLWLSPMLWAQNVEGVVTNEEDGTPIPGVSIVVKGTARAAITDLDGKYAISVKEGETLTFSLVGYQAKDVKVGNETRLDVMLGGGNVKMDEVIITALGIPKEKRQTGYASQQVGGEELASTQRVNMLESLQGRVAGLTINTTSGTPGASSQIILRQPTSFSQDNQPLFIIDGVPVNNSTMNQGQLVSDQPNRNNDYTNRIADINPDDIESVNVLKGPEAAALYGFYGANGAIIITTKKGKAGAGKINYSVNGGIQELTRFPEIQKEYGRGEGGYFDTRYRRHLGPKYAPGTQLYDNIGNFFQRGTNTQHNLSFEGGTDRTSYRFSAALADNQGVVPNTNLRRINIGMRGSTKISDKLEITTGLNFVNSLNSKASKGANSIFQTILIWPQDDNMANYTDSLGNRRTLSNAGLDTEFDNPYFDINNNRSQDLTNRFFSNIGLVYNPTKWLNFTVNGGYDFASTKGFTFTHPQSQRGIGVRGSIENYVDNNRVLNLTYFTRLSHDIGKLNIGLRLGGAVDEQNRVTASASGERLIVANLNSINNVDQTTYRSRDIKSLRRSLGFFGDVTFDYNRFLTLNASLRNDITSTLPIDSRSFYYPSMNLSFVFSELLKSQEKWLSFGKLRFSIAGSGKDVPPYNIKSEMRPQVTTGGGYIFGFTGNAPDLRPEIIRSYSGGIEMNFFKERVGIDFTAYQQQTDDMLFRLFRISYGTGFILKNLNLGTLKTNGVELVLSLVPVKTKNFNWKTTFNAMRGSGSFSGFPQNIPEFYVSDSWLANNARASVFQENILTQYGYSTTRGNISLIGGWRYQRNTRGDVLINPASGLPLIDNNFNPIGDRNPDFMLGMVNRFKFKTMEFQVTIDGRKGGDIYNGTAAFLWSQGLHPNTVNREQPIVVPGVLRDGFENTENPTKNNIQITPYFNSNYYRTWAEESFIEKDINWVRIRDVRLSYSVPSAMIKNWRLIKKLSLYLGGTDLYTWTNYTGADPNVNGLTAGVPGLNATGFDFGVLPTPRTFNFGLNVGF
jgi:TonB-linked SusC/RagA family outer membrane protein